MNEGPSLYLESKSIYSGAQIRSLNSISIPLLNLTAETSYVIYAVLKDKGKNLSHI
jgi:hypothetical protein